MIKTVFEYNRWGQSLLEYYISNYVNGVEIRSYEEVKSFISNIENDLLSKITKDNEQRSNYIEMLSEYNSDNKLNIDLSTYRKINDLFLLNCRYNNVYFQIVMSKKEFANVRIRS